MNAIAYWFVNAMESEASAIARGLRRRDPDLLDRLIEQYQHRLLRYLVYLSGNRELAEDLFQETWIRVLERGHQYDGQHEFSTWLSTVARNLTIDYLRTKRPLSLDGLMEDEEHAPLEPADTRPMAWEVVQQHEQAERISAALVSIPAEYRETVVLRYSAGMLTNAALMRSACSCCCTTSHAMGRVSAGSSGACSSSSISPSRLSGLFVRK